MCSYKDYQLRPIEEKDLKIVLEWRNSDRIRANMFTDSIITIDQHLTWYEKIKLSNSTVCLVFTYKGQPSGLVSFTDIDFDNNTCSWGFYLGKEDPPPGSGSIMGFLGLKFAFEKLDIHSVHGEVFAFNIPSIKFHKKLGFVEESRLLEHALKNGKYEDVFLFTLVKDVWLDNLQRIEKLILTSSQSC
jgi:UDP-4-amino-4,6-dideoxy-N-acetyl-beta-L-altrosamine N-acetyltransferase